MYNCDTCGVWRGDQVPDDWTEGCTAGSDGHRWDSDGELLYQGSTGVCLRGQSRPSSNSS